ncbi:hypothetical protein E3Q10_03331 [Wallemia mellicola]|uniref:Uncharacterized protein n=1 Tax=Wallemia mellicola TaxID=1708541 RepID=A0A4T0QT16_9BASI|nr:hypothetical protein E3Q10_03331 [Wallemia mellicola]
MNVIPLLRMGNDADAETGALNKKLAMRACCADHYSKRDQSTGYSPLRPNHADAAVMSVPPEEAEQKDLDTLIYDNRTNPEQQAIMVRDIENGRYVPGSPRASAWWQTIVGGTVDSFLSNLLWNLADRAHQEGYSSRNCFDQVSTWLDDTYKMSFQVRGAGNCGTDAETQTIYDALIEIVDKWRERQARRACETIDMREVEGLNLLCRRQDNPFMKYSTKIRSFTPVKQMNTVNPLVKKYTLSMMSCSLYNI